MRTACAAYAAALLCLGAAPALAQSVGTGKWSLKCIVYPIGNTFVVLGTSSAPPDRVCSVECTGTRSDNSTSTISCAGIPLSNGLQDVPLCVSDMSLDPWVDAKLSSNSKCTPK